MKGKHVTFLMVVVAGALVIGTLIAPGSLGLLGASQATPVPTPVPFPDAYKTGSEQTLDVPQDGPSPQHLTHPCGGLHPEPPFEGLSPLSFGYVPGICTSGYGDLGVWQADGQSYVAIARFGAPGFHIFNVTDPYNPTVAVSRSLTGGTATTTIFAFKQGSNNYVSLSVRGSRPSCGWYVFNVNDPTNPVQVTRADGADWCTVHEHFVSTNTNGDADYAWLAMSGESGSGYKVVVLNLANILVPVETGRYQRPDSGSSIFIHDVTVIGERVFLAHWLGGLIIHDKQTLANNVNPTPLNPLDSIRPAGFRVHHAWPTTDGNYVFIEDEFLNLSNQEKVKMYNISDITNPQYVLGIIGEGQAATAQAHNLKIQNIAPGLDRLYVAWYRAGTRAFEVNTNVSPPTVVQTIRHELRQTAGPGFGGAWGVDYLPCTVRGQQTTCIYTADYERFGLVVDALDYDPARDPYNPESQVTSPTNGQIINTCSFTIQGNAHDYYSGLAQVEVSTDNGATWQAVQGTSTWSYEWTIPADGPYTIKARTRDVAGNVAESAAVNVTVAGSCGGVTTPTPSNTPVPPTNTAVPPTNTAVPPTMTQPPPTHTTEPTNTVVPPTDTPVPPTHTPVPPTATTARPSFNDVPPSNPFYPHITCLAARGIVSGYDDGSFRPGNEVTRGQLSKIVAGAANLNGNPGEQMFADVDPNHPFYTWINRLARTGVMGGYDCGGPGEPCSSGMPYFRPFANATRGQTSKIVANAANINDPVSGQTFEDVPASHPFYLWIEQLASRGVMGGYDCGEPGEPCISGRPYFRAYNPVTRGQSSKIVANTFFPGCEGTQR